MKNVIILLALSTFALFSSDFPQFMGPDRNNIVNDTKLLKTWPAEGLKEVWRVKVAGGFGAPAVFWDKLYLLDYDPEKVEDVVRCLDAKTAKEEWRFSYPSKFEKSQYDYSRTMPAVTDRYVVTFGPSCIVTCVERVTGKFVWQKDLVKEYGTLVPKWAAGQNAFVDGNKVIVSVCGKSVLIAAFDIAAGKAVWETPCKENYGMTHNTITKMSVDGQDIYLGCSKKATFAVSAADGKLLLDYKGWTVRTANIPVPLVIGKNKVFFTGGYKGGSLIASLKKEGSQIVITEDVRLPESDFGSHVHTPILYNNHIYGISTGLLKCLDLNGKVLWDSGKQKFGLGGLLIADNRLYVLSEKGELFMLEASPAAYKQLAKAKVFEGKMIWAPLVISNGMMYIRNMNEMTAIDLK
ncbi:MAG: hypothetical protein A2231_04930 [Candidatus Firestonebacteria bacterium RIFOXYA2_FULL_40_8]|nr:MAG: hypothetical protein A2231_04930 [Candidatus Firestonebacteria bacterium RIFOXYA2_FULL_40_8]